MFFTLLEVGIVAILSIYLGISQIMIRRRQSQAWDLLVKYLETSGISSEFRAPFVTGEHEPVPDVRKRRIQGAHDLWSMYEGARVMLDMANFAAANSATVDEELLTELRRDAMQIRVCVLAELSKQTCNQLSVSTCENAARAAAVYADMVSRMADVLQANSGMLIPASVPTA
jgi:hypothetical protein